jgi:hypothetical protein
MYEFLSLVDVGLRAMEKAMGHVLSRRSFHRADVFLLLCKEHKLLLKSIALYVFCDFQSNGRGPSR